MIATYDMKMDSLVNINPIWRPSHHFQLVDAVTPQKVCIIVALDAAGGYSKDGKIPWHYSADFKWFRKVTGNNPCVMGRTTYDDICTRLGDKAKDSVLPGRQCYVVTSRPIESTNAKAVPKLDVLLNDIYSSESESLFVLGGVGLFEEALDYADEVYVTIINKTFDCDKFFPVKRLLDGFQLTAKYRAVNDEPDLLFTIWTRKKREIIKP
jgi:dihydrofolate reductase